MYHVHVIVKDGQSVNLKVPSGPFLEKALAERMEQLLGSVPWLRDWHIERTHQGRDQAVDLTATVPLPGGGQASLQIECKANPRPSLVPNVSITNETGAKQQRLSHIPVFAAPYISPRLADVCWDRGWSWFDLAGNCRLNLPGALYIERSGHKLPNARLTPKANLGTAEAARIIRALLVADNATRRWTQRELQVYSYPPVSLGLVNKVIRHLCDEAFVVEIPCDGGFRLRDPLGLLTAWNQAYCFDHHQRRGYFTLLQGKRLQEALVGLESLTGGHAAYAAFSAADFQAPNVRQPKTWLYVGAEYLDQFCAATEAKSVDSGENLVVLVPEDDGVFLLHDGSEGRLGCTTPVQTYVDLTHCGGRGQEAAQALLEQQLKPAWKLAGLL